MINYAFTNVIIDECTVWHNAASHCNTTGHMSANICRTFHQFIWCCTSTQTAFFDLANQRAIIL